MTIHIHEMPALDADSGRLNVIIDMPKGCRNKYKFDERNGVWRLSKVLPQGMVFRMTSASFHRCAAKTAIQSMYFCS